MFATIAIATAAVTMPLPGPQSSGRYRCGAEETRLALRRRGSFLMVGAAQYSLRRVRSGPGTRYAGRGVEFEERGRAATLTIGRRAPIACLISPLPQPYRAIGQEPGWSLDLDAAGRSAVFSYDYGKRTAREALRPWVVVAGPARSYSSVSGRLAIRAQPGGCADAMSGRDFADTVTVTFRGKSYSGCGGPAGR